MNGPASAISAILTITTGEKTQVIVNQPGNAYLSYNDPRIHVGLGKYNKIDKLEIRWPQGEKEIYTDIWANQYLEILQGKGVK